MLRIRKFTATITTATGGTATAYAGETGQIHGRLVGVSLTSGDLADSIQFTITGETTGVPILTYTMATCIDAYWFAKGLVTDNTDGSLSTDNFADIYLMSERIKVAIVAGGNEASGSITFYVEVNE